MSSHNLVIVESPGKIQAISKYLGSDYTVMASMGHVRDLPKNKMGIDTEHNFEPSYIIPMDKKKVITGLKAKIGKDTTVYIATDEDREGEAIGWHLVEALGLSKHSKLKRIVFHEITKPAILEAVENPRTIDKHLVDAQQTRRVLDRLVGYELSPLLWKKIKYGLSAGRVQSVALRLIVEREREIQAFKPEEYWTILAELTTEQAKLPFVAKVAQKDGKTFDPHSEAEVQETLGDLKGATIEVTSVEKKEVNRYPSPPFTTSTLQQEAARKLGFSVKKTMTVAQHLYEGVELSTGHEGLITYMRTDSVNLSPIALKQAREVVGSLFGAEYALSEPRYFKGKKGAQEAHEAVRPTDLSRTPDQMARYLSKDELRLYELIWKRTLACQMAHAVFNQVGVDMKAGRYGLRATGQTVKFPGFIQVYMEGHDLEDAADDEDEKRLPELHEGEHPSLKNWLPEQHFTKAPPRYTEASLVKKLEAEGIGRPSTYAPTISTILAREYIVSEKKQLAPTEMGLVVNDFLVEHFPKILDYQFTVKMEAMLDAIAEGDESWQEELRDFYKPFHALVEDKMKTLTKEDVLTEKTDEICEICGAPMAIRFGRFGKFLSCTNFPTCKNARPIKADGTIVTAEEAEEDRAAKAKELGDMEAKLGKKSCSTCGKPMRVKTGRFGPYWACEDYPKCKTSEAITQGIGVKCPECGEAELTERHTRRGGKPFYGCPRYPKCRFAIWEKPTDEAHAKAIHEAEVAKSAARDAKGAKSAKPVKATKSAKPVKSAKSAKPAAKKSVAKKKKA